MKTIENLLAEYDIRFNKTKKIQEVNYPFGHYKKLNSGAYDPIVKLWLDGEYAGQVMSIANDEGVVYENDIWATADLKGKPDKWVVEMQEKHPMWQSFKDWWTQSRGEYKNVRFILINNEFNRFFSYYGGFNSILDEELKDHQYLTLDQWAEFFLPKVDFSILNDENWKVVKYRTLDKYEHTALVKKAHVNADGNIKTDIYFLFSISKVFKGLFVGKKQVTSIHYATPEDLAPMYEKYPELAPPKVGDWGIFWDDTIDLKEDELTVAKLTSINGSSCYPFACKSDTTEKFTKIDITKPLQPQIDEFLKQKK